MMIIAAVGLLSTAIPVMAHHSVTAEFDPEKTMLVKGVLTKVLWTSPHIWMFVDVTENGKVVQYSFESGPPTALRRAGVKKEDFVIGDTVTVQAAPAKKEDMKTKGWVKQIKYSDGHVFIYRDGSE
jgi:hypothetical protein